MLGYESNRKGIASERMESKEIMATKVDEGGVTIDAQWEGSRNSSSFSLQLMRLASTVSWLHVGLLGS